MQEERVLHEAKLAKMEAEMKMVFQQKVQEKEAKLKQSEEELYARHKDMKDALEKQRADLEEKKKKIESGRPITPEKNSVSEPVSFLPVSAVAHLFVDRQTEGILAHLSVALSNCVNMWLHCCMYRAFLLLTFSRTSSSLVLLPVHLSQRTHSLS
jgi:hypothetical protein